MSRSKAKNRSDTLFISDPNSCSGIICFFSPGRLSTDREQEKQVLRMKLFRTIKHLF
jgi:hypothetical protein